MVCLGWFGRIALGTVVVMLAASCGGGDEAAPPAPVVSVGIGEVRRDTMTAVTSVVGRLGPIPGGSATLTAPIDGVVGAVNVAVGQRVGSGTNLVRLEAPELASQATGLRAGAGAADRDAARQQELLKQGIASRRQVEERTAAALAASAAAAAAEALLARTRVASPLRGVVQRVLVQRGERVSAGQLLVEVIDDRVLDLVAAVPLVELAGIRVGQKASVSAGEGTMARTARVHALAPALDSVTNTGQVVIRILSPGPTLRAGAMATALVQTGKSIEGLIVPDSALVLVGGQLHVFVVGADSIARARPVVVGVRFGGRAQVTGPLVAGDRVVTRGAYGLPDSVRVVTAVADSL